LPDPQGIVRFGPFELEILTGELRNGSARLRVPDQSIQVLATLLERPGELITRDQLRKRLWPADTFVDFEHGLNAAVRRLRVALNDSAESPRFIETLPRRGYRFIGEVHREIVPATAETAKTEATVAPAVERQQSNQGAQRPVRTGVVVVIALVVAVVVGVLASRTPTGRREGATVQSLAVLPLLPLKDREGDNYFGLGLADTIIARLNRTGRVRVRPTSAIRRYASGDTDAIAAGMALQTDAVLEGTWVREGNRLRVTINLLRVPDRESLSADTFDVPGSDIFALQDQLAQRLVSRLRLPLDPDQQAALTERGTSNPQAYEFYTKGVYFFSERGHTADRRAASDTALALFRQATELDPSYALAHAHLGFAYAWTAIFIEDAPELIERAKQELAEAAAIDDLALVHLARGFISYSRYEGWQIREALRELRRAESLDPRLSDLESAAIYWHVGLFDQWRPRWESVLENDPTNLQAKRTIVNEFFLGNMPEEGLAEQQRLLNQDPDERYFLLTRQVDKAAPLIERWVREQPDNPWSLIHLARLRALQGHHREAQALLPRIISLTPRNRSYHHMTFDIARVYALGGNDEAAVRWLSTTIQEGFPAYPVFDRDWHFDRIRQSGRFQQTMKDLRVQWESYKTEFGNQ
jgi:DNA-binding winged helix-turn-helix (wHTH) protein/TolB-like protein